MPSAPRIASARLHRAGSADCSAGGRAVADYLHENAGDEYAVVEVERAEGRFSLIVDPEWIRLAQCTSEVSEALVEGVGLPRSALLAVVAGWDTDWSTAAPDLSVEHSPDEIPHLRLAASRPSPSGADRNVPRS